jgi:hypothetical protein
MGDEVMEKPPEQVRRRPFPKGRSGNPAGVLRTIKIPLLQRPSSVHYNPQAIDQKRIIPETPPRDASFSSVFPGPAEKCKGYQRVAARGFAAIFRCPLHSPLATT